LQWLMGPRLAPTHNGWRLDLIRSADIQCRPMKVRVRTTLGDLQRSLPWVWLNCEKCQHYAPLPCAVPVIRWGAGTSSDVLRERARCTACGGDAPGFVQRPQPVRAVRGCSYVTGLVTSLDREANRRIRQCGRCYLHLDDPQET
jgi:hypothetical protein